MLLFFLCVFSLLAGHGLPLRKAPFARIFFLVVVAALMAKLAQSIIAR
jgi:hypothetical protein